jgi:paraquat-inducible protein B
MSDDTTELLPAEPVLRQRRRLSLVWLIPIVATLLAGFLLWRSWSQQGPTITITFHTAEGIEVGKTKIKLKAVDIGTVSAVHIAPDRDHVIVQVDMTREATDDLTDRARFWMVKPRVSAGNISGLDTLLSGSYIAIDPGAAGGKRQLKFTGLEVPPVVASDEPGRAFLLHAARLGSVGPGSPVFYHGLAAGEVQGYDLGTNADSVTLHVFIRQPYDQYVHEASRFWNASGVTLQTNADGLKLQVESLQAVLSGAIAFDTPAEAAATPVARDGRDYALFEDEDAAKAAGFSRHVRMVAHLRGSVRGLTVGSPVELFGIRIGSVTDVRLHYEAETRELGVAVHLDVQPDRFTVENAPVTHGADQIIRALLAQGMRAQLRSTNLITGQMAVAFDFFPDAPRAALETEGDELVLPSQPTDMANITRSVSDIADKLNRLPLDEIGKTLLSTLQSADKLAASPELHASLQSMATATATLQDVLKRVDDGLTPALRQLPALTASLQQATDRAGKAMRSIDDGYGADSGFHRDMERLMSQVTEMTRAVRFLAEFLDEHPEALLRGRKEEGSGK